MNHSLKNHLEIGPFFTPLLFSDELIDLEYKIEHQESFQELIKKNQITD